MNKFITRVAEVRKAIAALVATFPVVAWIAGTETFDWRLVAAAVANAVVVWLVPNKAPSE